MANTFEGEPDARQGQSTTPESVTRFRPRYRQLSPAELALHDAIKAKASELEALYEQVKPGRYLALGFTELEASVMWTVKQLTGEGLK